MSKYYFDKWRAAGVKAGKTDGWMRLDETLAEDLERHSQYVRDPQELVQTGINSWEETDHFEILYGSKMMDDAKFYLKGDSDSETMVESIELWQELKDEFWEGYLEGRKAIGRDVYAIARKLIASKKLGTAEKSKPRAKSAARKSGRSQPPSATLRGLR